MLEIDYVTRIITVKSKNCKIKKPLKRKWDLQSPDYALHHDSWVLKYFFEDFLNKKEHTDLEKIRIDFKRNKVQKYYNKHKHIFFYDFEDLPTFKVQFYNNLKNKVDHFLVVT